jgi:hypothetical protein
MRHPSEGLDSLYDFIGGVTMDTRNSGRQSHVLLLAATSVSWAAIPFLPRDLSIEAAAGSSMILLVASAVAYLFVRKYANSHYTF